MSEKKCTNCTENGLECTFAGAIAKRRRSVTASRIENAYQWCRSYVDALEARLELTEQLLRKESLELHAQRP
jgi:hypothetical protein